MADFTTIYDNFLTNKQSQEEFLTTPARGSAIGRDLYKLRDIDRTNQAARFNIIYSQLRNIDDIALDNPTYPDRAWKNILFQQTSNNYYSIVAQGIISIIPSPFPASNNYTGTHDGTTSTYGSVYCRSLARNSDVLFSVRRISFNTDNSQPPTGVSSWKNIQLSHGSTQYFNFQGNNLLYPNLSEPGDTIEFRIAFKQKDTSQPAYLGGFQIIEERLTSV